MKLQIEKLELLSASELTEINGGEDVSAAFATMFKSLVDFVSSKWDSFGQACEDAGRSLGCWLRSIFAD